MCSLRFASSRPNLKSMALIGIIARKPKNKEVHVIFLKVLCNNRTGFPNALTLFDIKFCVHI